MTTKKIIKSLAQAVEISLRSSDSVSYDANFEVEIEGKIYNVYDVTIAERDILVTFKEGTATYLVDTYGNDKSFAVLHDWELDEIEESGNDWIAFSATYKGQDVRLSIPISELSICTRDNETDFKVEEVAPLLKKIKFEDMY